MDRATYIAELAAWAWAEHADLVEAQDYEAIASAANAQEVVTGTQTAPKPWALAEVFEAIKDADPQGVEAMAATYGPLVALLERALDQNDRRSIANYAALIGSQLNQAAQQAIGAMLAETVEIEVKSRAPSIATANGWPVVRPSDAQEALL